MYSDIHYLIPADAYINQKRSNYPYARNNGENITYTNGSKLGKSTTPGYTNTVYEPIDEFKGDVARYLLYFATRYEGNLNVYNYLLSTSPLDGTEEKAYEDWYITMLKDWNALDPVSQKEIDRNNGIQATQGNRNPFIDYPCLAEYLWGNSKDATVTLSSLCGSFEAGFVAGSSFGCSSCSSGSIPTVTSPTYNEGSAGGNITSLGDPATITENGIYYSTTSGFSNEAGTKLAASTTATTTGTFSVDVSTLPEGTYYFKAFAKNSTGTGYSAQETFTITGASQAPSTTPLVLMGTSVTNALTCTGTKTLLLRISNLATSVNVTSSATGIVTVSPATISPAEAAAGVTLTVTKVTIGTANITISGGVVNQTINVTCQ